jgi:hypothetical protein
MRLSAPVDPYFKTAGRVATLKFVGKTYIPVPRVIYLDYSAGKELSFEWILMAKLPGDSLESLWESPNLLWDSRVQITKTLAGYVKKLRSFTFSLLGNLSLSSRPEFGRVA